MITCESVSVCICLWTSYQQVWAQGFAINNDVYVYEVIQHGTEVQKPWCI